MGRARASGCERGEEGFVDFLQCKGLVEAILELFHVAKLVTWTQCQARILYTQASPPNCFVSETALGYLGELHPDIAQQLELPSFFLFELDFEKLLKYAPARITINALPRFPAVERDVALVVDRDFASQHVIQWIQESRRNFDRTC